jgi:hypothetical protein
VTVIDNAIYIDGKRAIVPKSLDQTFMALAGRPWMDETRGAAR